MTDRAVAPEPGPERPYGAGDTAPTQVSAWRAAALFCALAAVASVIVGVSTTFMNRGGNPDRYHLPGVAAWLEGWVQWDGGWYRGIADRGYWFDVGQQSPVAFFPAYPMLMRAGGLLGNTAVAGVAITLASGLTAATLFFVWLRDRLAPPAAWTALLLFLLYPYAIYLYGVAYADALFIAASLGAFVLLEHDRPVLAGLAGAVATAARPLGVAVIAALVLRTLERRGALDLPLRRAARALHLPLRRAARALHLPLQRAARALHLPLQRAARALPWSPRPDEPQSSRDGGAIAVALKRLRPRDWGVLLALGGLSAYCLYLWLDFGNPFLFVEAEKAWGQGAGPHTWFKVTFFENVTNVSDPTAWLAYIAHPVVTIVALAFVPRVFRRFGFSYGVYALLAVGLPALATKDFFGMGRYVLAAFPCFAVAGELLAERSNLRAWVLAVSGAGLVVFLSFFARGSYLS